MRQIADVDGIEQPGGSFLHQRTHILDPKRSVGPVLLKGHFQTIAAILAVILVSRSSAPLQAVEWRPRRGGGCGTPLPAVKRVAAPAQPYRDCAMAGGGDKAHRSWNR
jgi:hypothetical protein